MEDLIKSSDMFELNFGRDQMSELVHHVRHGSLVEAGFLFGLALDKRAALKPLCHAMTSEQEWSRLYCVLSIYFERCRLYDIYNDQRTLWRAQCRQGVKKPWWKFW